jgi:hypothetical protein
VFAGARGLVVGGVIVYPIVSCFDGTTYSSAADLYAEYHTTLEAIIYIAEMIKWPLGLAAAVGAVVSAPLAVAGALLSCPAAICGAVMPWGPVVNGRPVLLGLVEKKINGHALRRSDASEALNEWGKLIRKATLSTVRDMISPLLSPALRLLNWGRRRR